MCGFFLSFYFVYFFVVLAVVSLFAFVSMSDEISPFGNNSVLLNWIELKISRFKEGKHLYTIMSLGRGLNWTENELFTEG